MLPGYFPSRYAAIGYSATGYWPDVIPTALAGVLLTPGYWPDAYFARSIWQPLYWPKYEVAVAETDRGGYWRSEYQLAYERLQDRKRKARRIHRDDQDVLELLAMFTGHWDA